jgi:hypothetical protein
VVAEAVFAITLILIVEGRGLSSGLVSGREEITAGWVSMEISEKGRNADLGDERGAGPGGVIEEEGHLFTRAHKPHQP